MECNSCKQTTRTFECDNCSHNLCKTCSKLTSSEVKVMDLGKRVMKFYCRECEDLETLKILSSLVQSKNETIATKDEIISLLKKELDELKTKTKQLDVQAPSFASIVSKQPTLSGKITQNIPNLIIKPKGQQGSEITKTDVMTQIKPAEINIGINKIRCGKSGSLIVKCNDMKNLQKLKNEVTQRLNDYYEVEETKLRNPQIKIVGYSDNEEITIEELERAIKNQNSFIPEDEFFKVTYIKETKLNTKIIFAECSPSVYQIIMFHKKVCIGWERYPVYENLSLKQCFKCNGFYHKNTVCPNKTICSYCGGEHEKKDCELVATKQGMKCINCEHSNQKYKTSHNLSHQATDPECPTYKYHVEVMKSKINYV